MPRPAVLLSFALMLGLSPVALAQTEVDPTPAEAEAAADEKTTAESESESAAEADAASPEPTEPAPIEEEGPAAAEPPAAPGQVDLDKAIELKLTARGMRELNQVIELLDTAIEEGLDEGNEEFAESMLVATLLQRATALSGAVLNKPITNPRQDLRWLQVRQFALTDLQRAVAIDDDLVEAHLLIGRLQSLPLGDPNAARRALGKVVRAEGVRPRDRATAYALRGATQRSPEKRLADFAEAIALAPEKVEYRLLRAREHQRANNYDDAMADLDAAMELAPENASVHELRAMILLAQDKPDEAIESFDRASELSPESLGAYQFRGEAYSRLGDLGKAIEQLDKAIEIDANNVASRLIRAQLYLMDAQAEAALADIQIVLAQRPGLLRAHLMRTAVLEELGRRDEAVAALEALAKAAPKQAEVHLQLAAYYQDAGRYEDAIESLSRVIEIASDNVVALRLRGDIYLSIGKHNDALADFERAFDLRPDDPGLLNNFAWTLATSPFDELRNGERAVELASKAAELTEFDQSHILSTLAAAYAESGDFDRAVEWAERAVELELGEADEPEAGRDIAQQLSDELSSYRRGEPWRELQQAGSTEAGVPEPGEPAPVETDEPARTLDF